MAENAKATPAQRNTWPAPFIVEPQSSHTHTFILLHGLGSNGEKFGRELLDTGISSSQKTLVDAFPGSKFIFPTAKKRRITALKRSRIPAWFDMYSLTDRSLREDVQIEGLVESSQYIRSIIIQEMEVLPAESIVLGGLSNGYAMSLMTLLSLEFPIGAYIGMSGRLPFRTDIDDTLRNADAPDDDMFSDESTTEKKHASSQALDFIRDIVALEQADGTGNSLRTPVFLGHGAKDDVVPCRLGEEAARTLTSLDMDVTWKSYSELAHWYQVPEEIDDILAFLFHRLAIAES
ncbi:acyl-protein thioesterase [Massarina eburnea CBS 473.64]|uniref:Acyl-protein thioesterase n=1 Tax=Massarina eburnea CBS 473.64 TaxID=1395130 RepID=A0A6A6SE70_9PLEO|nr:acyl-protein thioesterase [Massarina eburnea CBS 473.64]